MNKLISSTLYLFTAAWLYLQTGGFCMRDIYEAAVEEALIGWLKYVQTPITYRELQWEICLMKSISGGPTRYKLLRRFGPNIHE
jgi:hypothetical protein